MKYKQVLEDFAQENDLNKYVVNYINDRINVEEEDEVRSFLNDVTTHGCVSGMVGTLIYYYDTNRFFDDFEYEIQELIEECIESQGYNNKFEFIGSLNGADKVSTIEEEKNLLAWFAFEEVSYKLLSHLDNDKKHTKK